MACVAMILSTVGGTSKDNGSSVVTLEEILNACPSTSIWTIDLAYMLRYYGVEDFSEFCVASVAAFLSWDWHAKGLLAVSFARRLLVHHLI
jgi:hypothetical protein